MKCKHAGWRDTLGNSTSPAIRWYLGAYPDAKKKWQLSIARQELRKRGEPLS